MRSEEHTSELQSHSNLLFLVFFLNNPATPEISPLSLHDALPISLHDSWILVIAHAHLDVAGGADVGADVATDAQVVIGVHIAPHGRLRLGRALDRYLRAVDHAVVALEAQAAAHAALGFFHGLLLVQSEHALLEMAQYFIGVGHHLGAR